MDPSSTISPGAEQRLIHKYLQLRQDIEEEILTLEAVVHKAGSSGTTQEWLSSQEKLGLAIRRLCEHESVMREWGHGKTIDEERFTLKFGIKMLEDVVRIRSQLSAIDDPTLLHAQYELALMYNNDKHTVKAFQLLEKVTEIQNRRETGNPSSRMEHYSTLALWYMDVDDMAKAVPLLEWTVEQQVTKLGKEHDDTIVEQQMLASAYFQQKDYLRAIQFFEKLLSLIRRKYERTHPTLISTQSLLADVYIQIGQYQQAIDLLETITQVQENHYWDVQQLLFPSTLQRLREARNSIQSTRFLA